MACHAIEALTLKMYLPLAVLVQARKAIEQCGFASSVGANKTRNLSLLNFEGDTV